MKRPVAIILLMIGGILACGLGTLGLAAPFFLTSGLNLLCFLSIAVHIAGAFFIQGLYQRRGWLNKWQFWLCAGLPSTMIGVAMLIVVMILDNAGYFHGFFAGLGEFLISFAILVYSGVFFALLGIVLLIKHAVCRKDRIPVILLVIGGVLACTIAAALCAALILGASQWLWFLCAVVLAGHIAGAELLQRLYQKRGWLNALNFWVYSGLPAFIVGIVLKIVDVLRSGAWYFTDELVSVAAALLLVYPVIFLALFGIWLLGSAPVRKDKS